MEKDRTDRSYEKVACYGYPSGTHTNSSASRNGGSNESSYRPGSSGEEPIDRTRGRDPWALAQGPIVTQSSLGSRQIVRGAAVLGSRGGDTTRKPFPAVLLVESASLSQRYPTTPAEAPNTHPAHPAAQHPAA
jgi:hypothetical protein